MFPTAQYAGNRRECWGSFWERSFAAACLRGARTTDKLDHASHTSLTRQRRNRAADLRLRFGLLWADRNAGQHATINSAVGVWLSAGPYNNRLPFLPMTRVAPQCRSV